LIKAIWEKQNDKDQEKNRIEELIIKHEKEIKQKKEQKTNIMKEIITQSNDDDRNLYRKMKENIEREIYSLNNNLEVLRSKQSSMINID
jgi:hypothetical protein